MDQFKAENEHLFYGVKILDNPRKTLNTGLNLGFKNSDGDCYLKVDAHSQIPTNFIEANVKVIESGQKVGLLPPQTFCPYKLYRSQCQSD